MRLRHTSYLAMALLVNGIWFLALVTLSRDFFLRTLELSAWEFFGLLEVAGCAVAFGFRRAILTASCRKSIALGLALPFVALYVFIVTMLLYQHSAGRLGGGDIGTSLVYGPFYLVSYGYVVFPLGVGSQFVMRWVGVGAPIASRKSSS